MSNPMSNHMNRIPEIKREAEEIIKAIKRYEDAKNALEEALPPRMAKLASLVDSTTSEPSDEDEDDDDEEDPPPPTTYRIERDATLTAAYKKAKEEWGAAPCLRSRYEKLPPLIREHFYPYERLRKEGETFLFDVSELSV